MSYENTDPQDEEAKLEEQLDEQNELSEVNEGKQEKPSENPEKSQSKNPEDMALVKPEMKKTGDTDLKKAEMEKAGDRDLKKPEVENTDDPELKKSEKTDEMKAMIKDENGSETAESPLIKTMRKQIQEIISEEGKNAPDVQIKGDKSGTVITLFDKNKTGMFSIGSARPSPEMVRIMKKIGELLSREKGKIIVGGHTDGRKFKSKTYDNWRLSSARAHMAYHMLVRGGVPESRFEMISGFGAVKLAVPDDPFSPVNRRIEISLRVS